MAGSQRMAGRNSRSATFNKMRLDSEPLFRSLVLRISVVLARVKTVKDKFVV